MQMQLQIARTDDDDELASRADLADRDGDGRTDGANRRRPVGRAGRSALDT
jgi:hypothetical protein